MASALIGHTGFVGGNLARRRRFDECYNSTNIERIAGRAFDLVVCAGAPAEKWKANRDPEADRRVLDRLWTALKGASAAKVVLISTVDVYARPVGVDEDDDVEAGRATPYGRHRHELERRVADHFDALVVRLPGLFGEGLKKNVIYDFLHDNNLDQIDRRAAYQFYPLSRLWDDVEVAMRAGCAS
jgi:nucleoside-diphosphate-sugar epimerase